MKRSAQECQTGKFSRLAVGQSGGISAFVEALRVGHTTTREAASHAR